MCHIKWTMLTTDGKRSHVMSNRTIAWLASLETLFVAVRSHLPGVRLTDEFAKDLARDYLRRWIVRRGIAEGGFHLLELPLRP
jgi:hypothetical protein